MKLEVVEVKEREDGGADIEFDLDNEGTKVLVSLGVKMLLIMALANMTVEEIMEALIDREEE